MGLDREDRIWLDGKFGEVHTRITKSKEELTEKINTVQLDLTDHKAKPCPEVEKHVAEKHSLPKFVAFIASIMGVVLLAYKLLIWIVDQANVRP